MAIQCQCGMAALVILWSHLSTGLLPKVPFTANTFVLICVFPRVQLLKSFTGYGNEPEYTEQEISK